MQCLTLCDLIQVWIVYTITFHPQSTKSQSSCIMGHPNGNGGYVNGIGYLVRWNLAPSRFTSHLICYNSGRNNDSEAFHIVRLVFSFHLTTSFSHLPPHLQNLPPSWIGRWEVVFEWQLMLMLEQDEEVGGCWANHSPLHTMSRQWYGSCVGKVSFWHQNVMIPLFFSLFPILYH